MGQKRKHASAHAAQEQVSQQEQPQSQVENTGGGTPMNDTVRKKKSEGSGGHETDAMVALHRLKFLPWQPASVVSIAGTTDGSMSVCVRENGVVEFIDMASNTVIKKCPGNMYSAPTSIVVADDETDASAPRVFVSGMDGTIVEIDAQTKGHRMSSDSLGGAVWNLAITKEESVDYKQEETAQEGEGQEEDRDDRTHNIAAACDDGCVRIFGVDRNVPGIQYIKSLPAVEGKVLATAWHPSGTRVVSGGTDGCIHVWDVITNRELLRITVEGISKGMEETRLCIWTLMVLSDGTIVSGDSHGAISFWDGQYGTMIAKFSPSGVDILSLAAAPHEDVVFCAGIDPKISAFKKVFRQDGRVEWSYLSSKKVHALDIRALYITWNKTKTQIGGIAGVTHAHLVSGGNDCRLFVHPVDRFLKEHPRLAHDVPQRPHVSNAVQSHGQGPSNRLIASAVDNIISIYKIQVAKHNGSTELNSRVPVHLADLNNKHGDHIIALAMNDTGDMVVFSDIQGIKCLQIAPFSSSSESYKVIERSIPIIPSNDDDMVDDILGIQSLKLPIAVSSHAASFLKFVPGTNTLVTVTHDGIIRTMEIHSSKNESGEASVSDLQTIRDIHDLRYKTWFKKDASKSFARKICETIDAIDISKNGKYIGVSSRNRVFIVSLETRHITTHIHSFVLEEGSRLASLCFTGEDHYIAVSTSKAEIAVFEVLSGSMCTLPGQEAAQFHQLGLEGTVFGATQSPTVSKGILLFSSRGLCHINFDQPLIDEEKEAMKLGRRPQDKQVKLGYNKAMKGRNGRVLPCADVLLHVSPISHHDIIMVEKSWGDVWSSKAPPVHRHRYGT